MKQFYLETERLHLRNWEKADTALFIEMNKSKEVMQYFPSTLNESQTLTTLERISNHFNKHGYGCVQAISATSDFSKYTSLADL